MNHDMILAAGKHDHLLNKPTPKVGLLNILVRLKMWLES